MTRTMEAFSWREIKDSFDLNRALEWGSLPLVHADPKGAPEILEAYANTYIREEIKEEGAVRNLPPFLRFLQVAGQVNAQAVNVLSIARDAAIPRSSAKVYFSILEDTLLGRFLPSYRPQVKIREQSHPKFFWFDPGVARAAAGLLFDPADRLWKGAALETFLYHELRVYNETQEKHRSIYYYRTRDGAEVDFVIETRKPQGGEAARVVCLEIKLAEKWERKWESAMRILGEEPRRLKVDKMFGIYTGKRVYHFDGVDVLPVEEFLRRLYQGEIF
ncbi:MAG: DUF4143 domain-containing protein [Candidatus Sumerlaeota bacterium]|nr:DUF4143 domain-containing protein [Candidatus Sumerlaeota bacterium]